jgi:ribonuclease HI
MAKKKDHYYVVWQGRAPGVYATWPACEQQVKGVEGALFKRFDTEAEARAAFAASPYDYVKRRATAKPVEKAAAAEDAAATAATTTAARRGAAAAEREAAPARRGAKKAPRRAKGALLQNPPDDRHDTVLPLPPEVTADALAVDAACAGNPGRMEYRGVCLATGAEVFHFGPVYGTNNIGEFLAIVHGLALLCRQQRTATIYSDSRNALLWVRAGRCKTTLARTARTEGLFQLIERAEKWLQTHDWHHIPLLKWETRRWGEVPADFGRK